jgi:alanine racemase
MHPTSYIELSESALKTNIDFIHKILGETELSCVLKGNAYGHGIDVFSQMLYKIGMRHFSVFSANEAQEILEVIPSDVTIMVMGYISHEQIEWAIENDVEFFVFDHQRLQTTISIAEKMGKAANIHVELETGMNRTGFNIRQIKTLFQTLFKNKEHVIIKGICSHLAGAESIANYKRIEQQYERFKRTKNRIQELDWLQPKFHLACSASCMQYPKTKLDLARIGILQYGFFPSDEVMVQYMAKYKTHQNPLKRVISWKTQVMDIKMVKSGEFIGYGTSFFTNKLTKIALLPIGYAHGFPRTLSNLGKVLIRGNRFNVIGTVNMNMTIVDITECENIEQGDEVVIIGKQGDEELTVSSFSNFSDLVNYELLTRLPANITRKIVE